MKITGTMNYNIDEDIIDWIYDDMFDVNTNAAHQDNSYLGFVNRTPTLAEVTGDNEVTITTRPDNVPTILNMIERFGDDAQAVANGGSVVVTFSEL